MASTWILTTVGKDRPGIVAGVTKILFNLGCNLEDSSMTRLGGEFAIMVVFSAPRALSRARLQHACAPLTKRLGLAVHLKSLSRAELSAKAFGTPHVISVYGADRPGIVFRVSELLARLRVNITDVSTHCAPQRRGRTPLYLMLLEIELPARVSIKNLEHQLKRLTKALGVTINLRSVEAAVL